MRLLHLILPAFVLCLWTCGQGDDEAPLPPPPEPEIIVDCVEIGDDSKLVPNRQLFLVPGVEVGALHHLPDHKSTGRGRKREV
ncbi:MAG: hypothetical protein AAFY48_19790, partial [Bacteroidota bacterium]